jgi:hypothetical protein
MATTAGLEGVHALVRTSIRRRKRSSVEVWELLEAALNPALDRPRIAAGVEVAEFVRRSGERYTMIRTGSDTCGSPRRIGKSSISSTGAGP